MELYFVLVEPAVPENIGAAARAINTMGFRSLRLVKPGDYLANEAKWLAHGSVEILEKAELFNNFHEAINDLDFVIGTTAKSRSAKHDYYTPEQARQLLIKKGSSIHKVGIVFGREESGLKNQELTLCDIASTIPLNNPYPSINLAQSVMLYSYVFSSLKPVDSGRQATGDQRLHKELRQAAMMIMETLDIRHDAVLFHRILERLATSNEDDARLFLSFAKKFKHKFE
jgi:tRNA/rRNA methyltransferase